MVVPIDSMKLPSKIILKLDILWETLIASNLMLDNSTRTKEFYLKKFGIKIPMILKRPLINPLRWDGKKCFVLELLEEEWIILWVQCITQPNYATNIQIYKLFFLARQIWCISLDPIYLTSLKFLKTFRKQDAGWFPSVELKKSKQKGFDGILDLDSCIVRLNGVITSQHQINFKEIH